MKLTKNDAQEVLHKLAIVADEPDLQHDYGITQAQAVALRDSVPQNGGEWLWPPGMADVVRGEMEDHVCVLRSTAEDARNANEVGQALQISKQAKRFERMFAALEADLITAAEFREADLAHRAVIERRAAA